MSVKKLTIEKIISNGMGIGRNDAGKVVMMPFVLAGEEVAYKVRKQHKDYIDARPISIISPSTCRTSPLCQHFTTCGGCDYQHILYSQQLVVKEEAILEQLQQSLQNVEGLATDVWQGITPSPEQFGYRQRLRLHVDAYGQVGFHRTASHDLEPVAACPLARNEINKLLTGLPENDSAVHLFAIAREIEILSSIADNLLVLLFHLKRKPRATDISAASKLQEDFPQLKAVILEGEGFQRIVINREEDDPDESSRIRLPFVLSEQDISSYELSFEAGGFSQVNHELNQILITTMLDWAGRSGAERLLDMFCGMGNFSIPLAFKGFTVAGFDQQRSAIRSAELNASRYGIDCNFFRASANRGLEMFLRQGGNCELLVIDPPRKGCRESIRDIVNSSCREIIYVSCEPATLCRDLNALVDHGFKIIKAAGFDMFPQTHHLETMVMLKRDSVI